MRAIVFLHIPKTAGQTVHNEISRVIGPGQTSPVRLHTQAKGAAQYPEGYRFYSGHLDWTDMQNVPQDRFVFSVLRNPKERIASFYFYILQEAQKLTPEQLELREFTGQHNVLTRSADDYFFKGDARWQRFVRDHYDNFYCSYFATRKMRGFRDIKALPKAELIEQALSGAAQINQIYSLKTLGQLEEDLRPLLGQCVNIAKTRHNTGTGPAGVKRWPELLARLERDDSVERLERFAKYDDLFMQKLRRRGAPI